MEDPDDCFNEELRRVAERMLVHIIGEHNNAALTTDFEHALFGPEFVDPALFLGGKLILNSSIFGAALRSLIAAKKVVADRKIDGTWYYRNVDKSGGSAKHG